jgi:uncharacterized protein (TIGR02145 family)
MKQSLSILIIVTVLIFAVSAMAQSKVVIVPQMMLLLTAKGDCNGDKDGTAYLDNCAICVGGNTGQSSLVTCVTTSTGQVWMDRNLGASRIALSPDDTEAYGDLYQWGRLSDGHQERLSEITDYNATSSEDIPGHSKFIIAEYNWINPANDNLWQKPDNTNNPCPQGFRVPTKDEWNTEINTWEDKNSTGAFDSPLKLVVAGARTRNTGLLFGEDSDGYYWSSDISVSNYAYFFSFHSSSAAYNTQRRAYGKSVRCIKN